MAGIYIAPDATRPSDIGAISGANRDRIAIGRVGAVQISGNGMAGALVEIWLTVSALSSLVIVTIAIGHSDMRRENRLRSRVIPRRRARRTAR